MSDKIKFDIVSEKLLDTKKCINLISDVQECFRPEKAKNIIFTVSSSGFHLTLAPEIEREQTKKLKKTVAKLAKLAYKKNIDPLLFVEKALFAAGVIENGFNYVQSIDVNKILEEEKCKNVS